MNGRASWLMGIGVGAGLLYLLDPLSGNRRRALLRDKMARALNKGGDALQTTSRDLTQRVQGLVAEARSRLQPEEVDDQLLVDRVRAKLGRYVSHPRAIEVDAVDGRVILRGPVLAHEVKALIVAVSRVRGVREVDNLLESHKQAGDVPGLQGGRTRPGDRPEVLQRHWAPAARLVAGGIGGALATYGLARRSVSGVLISAAGAGLLARAATNLEAKRITGLGAGRRAIDLQKTITIDAPVGEVFEFWADFQNFPRFMTHVREVRPTTTEGQTHWTVAGPAGMPVEFDAVVTEFLRDRVIAWKTVEGAPVAHAGIVRFDPARNGGTRLQIRMSYNPPAGALGHAVATLFGADPKSRMDDDLVRMKTLIETGRPPHDAAVRDTAWMSDR